jgi:phage anti-repressor protein
MLNMFKSPKKQETEIVNVQNINNVDNNLVIKLKQHFSDDEQQLYVTNLYMYMNYHPTQDYPINLEDVYKMIGFANKGNAMKTIKSNFVENEDYKIALFHMEKRKNEGGFNKETVMLNTDTFKNLCMIAKTDQGKKIRKYYVKLENIYNELIKQQFEQQKVELKLKDIETQRLLEEKELQLQEKELELIKYKEKVYEEIEKTGHIYVIKTDGGTKVGKTKDAVKKRIKGLQTGNMNDIQVLLDFKTSNADLLERTVHYILDRYRCNSNREFFDCDVDFIKTVVETIGKVIDTLKSCYQQITREEILAKLSENGININLETTKYEREIMYENKESNTIVLEEESELYNWLNNNIEPTKNGILRLKKICELYLDTDNVHAKLSNKIRLEIELWIKTRYKNLNYQYKDSCLHGERYRGWIGLKLK